MSDETEVPKQHRVQPELQHVRVIAGQSAIYADVTLNGKRWQGLSALTFHAEAGKPCLVTAKFFANVEIDAQMHIKTGAYTSVTLTNESDV